MTAGTLTTSAIDDVQERLHRMEGRRRYGILLGEGDAGGTWHTVEAPSLPEVLRGWRTGELAAAAGMAQAIAAMHILAVEVLEDLDEDGFADWDD